MKIEAVLMILVMTTVIETTLLLLLLLMMIVIVHKGNTVRENKGNMHNVTMKLYKSNMNNLAI